MIDVRWSVVAAALVVSACGGRSETACRGKADQLGRFLAAMDHDVPVLGPDDLHLVTRAGLPKLDVPPAPIVIVGTDGVVVQGVIVTDRAQLIAELTPTRARIADEIAAGKVPGRGLKATDAHLAIAEDAAWETVVWVVEGLHQAGFDTPYVAFGRRLATPPPPRTWVDDAFDNAARAAGDSGE